jgi:hypothetical protein
MTAMANAGYGWVWLRELIARLVAPRDTAPVSPARSAPVMGAAALARPATPQLAPNAVFTPTRPRSGRRNLVGREDELERILDAILQDGGHVVLYSERGRGKTSLSNMAIEALRRRGAIVGRFACEAQTQFDALIRGLARDLPNSLLAAQGDAAEGEGCEAMLPRHDLRPADVAAIPGRLTCPRIVFVVDEFDRVQDGETRTRLADTIKLLSDRGLPLSLIIVGVSATLEQIIGQHPSIERNIMAIHLPLLEDENIAEMLRKGGAQAGLLFSETAISAVTRVARGMPYMAQLMGLRITQAAVQRGDTHISDQDLRLSVDRLLRDASPNVVSTYAGLIGGEADHATRYALERIANADQDAWGRMQLVRDGASVNVGGQRVPADIWTRLQEARVLGSPDGNPGMVQFTDRALMYHVQLLALRDDFRAGQTVRTLRLHDVASHA